MTTTVQRRVRLTSNQWDALDAIAAARSVSVGVIFDEAVRSYLDPQATIAQAARIVNALAADRAAIMEKIDLLFLAAAEGLEGDGK